MLLTIVAVALVFFVVSDLAQLNTIFGFNLAFACLAVAIAAYFTAKPLIIAGAVLGAWALMSVRTLWIAGVDEQTLRFQAGAIGALVLAGLIATLARGALSRRPWLSLGGLSAALGVAVLLAAPT